MADPDKQPTDEQLAAFVDDELDPAARARVAALAERDPDVARRIAEQRAARDALRDGLPLPAPAAPLPAGLAEAARRLADAAEARRRAARSAVPVAPAATELDAARARREIAKSRRGRSYATAWTAVAASLVLAVAALVYRGAGDGATSPVAALAIDEAIGREHALHPLLETSPSGAALELGAADEVATARVLLTFRSRAGSYCREFAVQSRDVAAVALACRERGGWRVAAVERTAPIAAPDDRYAVATATDSAAIAAAVARLSAGDALSATGEALLLAGGWQ